MCKSNRESFLKKVVLKFTKHLRKSNTYVANTEIRSWSNTKRDRQRAGRHQGKNRSRLQLRFPRTPKWNSSLKCKFRKTKPSVEKNTSISQQIFSQWILSNKKVFLTNFYWKNPNKITIFSIPTVANSTSTSGRWGRWCVTGVPVGFAGGLQGKSHGKFGYKTYP